MTELERAKEYVRQRVQAQRDASAAVEDLLLACALEILKELWGYRITIADTHKMTDGARKRVDKVIEKYRVQIENAFEDYAIASVRANGWDDGRDAVLAYMGGTISGKTFSQRNATYMERFSKDMFNLLACAFYFGNTRDDAEAIVRRGYKTPYTDEIVRKAQNEGYKLDVPKYGFGVTNAAYGQIDKNVRDTIALTWGYADFERAYSLGATGFYVYRGSSYPCQTCGAHTGWLHTMKDDYPPYHGHCVCFAVFNY